MIFTGMDGVDLIVLLGQGVALYCGVQIGWHLCEGFKARRNKKRWTHWRR